MLDGTGPLPYLLLVLTTRLLSISAGEAMELKCQD